MKDKINKIGAISVDTGRIVITDPTNVERLPRYEKFPLSGRGKRKLFAKIKKDTAIVSETGIGDGLYPVYAVTGTIGDKRFGKRVKKIIIQFDTSQSRKIGKSLLRKFA